MGGVDLKGQLLNTYLVERKQINKWYMKLFKRTQFYSFKFCD
jgi:hypothetical protein